MENPKCSQKKIQKEESGILQKKQYKKTYLDKAGRYFRKNSLNKLNS
jgi:hypothetical protein